MSRAAAEALDAADPLAAFRDRFVIDDPSLIYMDGNSLGRLPIATEQRLATLIRQEWGGGLVRTWDEWLLWPGQVGDRLAEALLGAAPGQVVVSDSTTVNLYKCAVAALDARAERRVIVTDSENFPTDRYVVEGLSRQRGLTVRMVKSDPVERLTAEMVSDAIDDDVALVTFSHVSFASSAIADMPAITEVAHRAGALGAVGSVAHGRVVSRRARCLERGSCRRVHVQVREWRTRCAGLPLREPLPASAPAPADLGMVRPA